MNKRQLYHIWKELRPLRWWYFLLAASVTAALCVTALPANYSHMVRLREAVYRADEAGTDIQGPLSALQVYVTAHMNTDLVGSNGVYPPIQLKYTYERLQAAALKQANNDQVYSDAQAYCEGLNSSDFSGRNRIPCISDYVSSHGSTPAKTIPDSLYKFAFLSPRWSPDLAGWSAVATVLLIAAACGWFIFERWLIYRSRH